MQLPAAARAVRAPSLQLCPQHGGAARVQVSTHGGVDGACAVQGCGRCCECRWAICRRSRLLPDHPACCPADLHRKPRSPRKRLARRVAEERAKLGWVPAPDDQRHHHPHYSYSYGPGSPPAQGPAAAAAVAGGEGAYAGSGGGGGGFEPAAAPAEAQRPARVPRNFKTKLCIHYTRHNGNCSHGEQPVPGAAPGSTPVCSARQAGSPLAAARSCRPPHWHRLGADRRAGSHCWFAHGEAELRRYLLDEAALTAELARYGLRPQAQFSPLQQPVPAPAPAAPPGFSLPPPPHTWQQRHAAGLGPPPAPPPRRAAAPAAAGAVPLSASAQAEYLSTAAQLDDEHLPDAFICPITQARLGCWLLRARQRAAAWLPGLRRLPRRCRRPRLRPRRLPTRWLAPPSRQELFEDPVVAADGHSYDRHAIEAWLSGQSTSPMTGAPGCCLPPGTARSSLLAARLAALLLGCGTGGEPWRLDRGVPGRPVLRC